MDYRKTVTLKDGRTCVLRSATEEDAQAMMDMFVLTHGQTEFLTTYADEVTFTLDGEREYLRRHHENPREVELMAEVDGRIAGSAGVTCVRDVDKTRHRASFGISIDEAWWGLGIGRALTEACIECARAAGYVQLELAVVADNVRAVNLYKSVGFVEFGRNPKGFRTRDGRYQENLLMLLELDAEPREGGANPLS